MSGWSHFRKTWLKPEVYPLVGAMSAAIGICGYAIYNKTKCSTISWNKNRRITDATVSFKDEVVPVLTSVRGLSTSIFGADRQIFESSYNTKDDAEPLKFTVRVGEEPEEEAEAEQEQEQEPQVLEQAEEVVEEVKSAAAEVAEEVKSTTADVTEQIDLLDIKEENPEIVQAALDKALDVLQAEEKSALSQPSA